jgi:predicted DNA-binding transcriptional regulator AlpA
MEANERCLLDTKALESKLGKSRYWVQTSHKSLGIPSYKIGNAYFFVEVEVEAWLETKRFTALPLASYPVKISLLKKAG